MNSSLADPAKTLLLDALIDDSADSVLLLSDEHITGSDLNRCFSHATSTTLHVISNRYRTIKTTHKHHSFAFNDFVIDPQQHTFFDSVYIRIPKEKAVLRHLINSAHHALSIGGSLFFSGKKNEGVKSAQKIAQDTFNATASKIGKHNAALLYEIKKTNANEWASTSTSYQEHIKLAHTECDHISTLCSKPGQFGHQKIDLGSHLLCQHYAAIYDSFEVSPTRFLDLGCGYGYLTLHSKPYPLSERVATDNNAAALISCAKNCSDNGLDCHVIASDAGSVLEPAFDWIVCNPPFHRGFSNDSGLLNHFLDSARRLLSKHGQATFVVNEFIPLEREARASFNVIKQLDHAHGFNVYALSR
ncbi:MAG: methyltransferase [Pseudomonadota bacterium]